jgi:hypothetical protein
MGALMGVLGSLGSVAGGAGKAVMGAGKAVGGAGKAVGGGFKQAFTPSSSMGGPLQGAGSLGGAGGTPPVGTGTVLAPDAGGGGADGVKLKCPEEAAVVQRSPYPHFRLRQRPRPPYSPVKVVEFLRKFSLP